MTSSPDLIATPSTERYRLGKLLGNGGFGDVHEAWDPALQRTVAIKRLKPDLVRDQPDNLLQEARLAASLRHPAFIQIYSLEDDGHSKSIVMELVGGKTLHQLLSTTRLSRDQILDIVCQLADAMAQAHAAGLIHGDLKPANLMIEPSGQLRIMDFGLARKIDPLATESGDVLQTQGTIAYLAPEILNGKHPNTLSDIYAVGVLMYEMMHGERPFAHLHGLALAAAQIQSSCAQWAYALDADQDMVALVRAMCAPDPATRVPTMTAVKEASQRLRGASSAIPLLPTASSFSKSLPKSRRIVTFCAAAVLAALAGTAYFAPPESLSRQWLPSVSEAARMSNGMTALRQLDRDDSLDIATENFSTILEKQPKHAAATAGMALTYAMRYVSDRSDASWLQRADAGAQAALALDDQLALGYAAKSHVRGLQGRYDESLRLAQQALQLDPSNIFALNSKGEVLTRLQRYPEARSAINNARNTHPNERLFIDQLGTLLYRQTDYQAAEQAFRLSIDTEPDAVYAYANLSAVLIRQDREDEALQVLQQGLQIRPNGMLYTNLGAALFNRGNYIGAAKAFEHAVSVSKGNSINYLRWANLADTLRWIPGRERDSIEAYRNAAALLKSKMERSPNDATLASRMGLYAAKLGDKDTATQLSKKAVSALPADVDVRFRAAVAYESTGQRDAALTELASAQKLGYPTKLIGTEPDLLALRADPRFDLLRMERKQ
ncbi:MULTISPECIES: serine/threonine-protein kinase [Massilia]|uniref:serine/threonine-protein kinase n=1 Tax=Massilia TaxID=149698 RepID=UPI000F2DE136|nr:MULTISPECIES: serine/threonine-protein kinase [Massilia]MDY0962662.1 protein kinase [Massilia sp. CFBP9026]